MEPAVVFHESLMTALHEAHSEGSEWDVVLIEAGLSKNGTFYSEETLAGAVNLFEGVKACIYRFGDKLDHLPEDLVRAMPQGLAGNVVGWFEKARFTEFTKADGTKGKGIMARFRILEGAKWLRDNLVDAWKSGKRDLLGFSIDARGNARAAVIDGKNVRKVETITKVESTDVVTNPAAGGAVVRLVASFNGEVDWKNLVTIIRESRPQWLEGFAEPSAGADLQDYSLRVLEATHDRAAQILKDDVKEDEVDRIAEVGRGIKMIASAIQMIKDGKIDEAVKLLQSMLEENPVPEGGDERAQRMSSVSVPFKKVTAPAGQPAKESKTMPNEDGTLTAEEIEAKAKEQADADKALKEREDALAAREKQMRVQETTARIEAALKESGLPEKAVARLREQLVAKADGDDELTDDAIKETIAKEKEYVDSLKEAAAAPAPAPAPAALPPASGLGDAGDTPRVDVGADERKKIDLAWDGFFDNGRMVEGIEPFYSLRQAWGKITNSWCDPEILAHRILEAIAMAFPRNPITQMPAHLASLRENYGRLKESTCFLREAIVTADFPISFGDALFRRMQKDYKEDNKNDWRRVISSTENLTDLTNKHNLIRLGGIGDLPVVNEQAPYQELDSGATPTEENEQLTPSKRGGLVKLTWEAILADRVGVVRSIPRKLAKSAVRTIHKLVWDEIETNPLMQDGNALISAAHNNRLSGDGAISYANVATLIKALNKQTEQDTSERLGLEAAWLLTGPDLADSAVEITTSEFKDNGSEDATIASFIKAQGVQAFKTLGLGRTTAKQNHYYVVTTPQDAETIVVGFLGGRDRPDIFVQSPVDTPTQGAAFTADELTFKIRLGVGVKVADHRWIQGSLTP